MQHEPLFRVIICLLYLAVIGEAGVMKFVGRTTPSWFVDQFRSTWLGRLPAAPQWWTIAFLEVATAALFLVALVRGEPWHETQPYIEAGLLSASLVFVALCFGLRVAGDFVGAASGFVYAALSLLLWAAVVHTRGV